MQKHILSLCSPTGLVRGDKPKDAYFHVSILPQHRPSSVCLRGLGISIQGPFLLLSLQKLQRPPLPLREVGIHILNCLDDWLIVTDIVQGQGGQGRSLTSCAILAKPDTHALDDSPSLVNSPEEGPSNIGFLILILLRTHNTFVGLSHNTSGLSQSHPACC